ncbi:MAG TPA: hypothetical protein VJ464_22885 [Blastocatellia bacterium]|nr:hypothetical protein [Blastocatellia bacterium]
MAVRFRQLQVPKDVIGRLGMTAEEYRRHQEAGEKWCSGCKTWHPLAAFASYSAQPDGLQHHCRAWFANYRARRFARAALKRRRGR